MNTSGEWEHGGRTERRRWALDMLGRGAHEMAGISEGELRALLEEMRIYQAELLTQNQQLQETRRELEDSGDRWREMLDAAPVARLLMDSRGVVRRANREACRLVGRAAGRLVGRPFFRFVSQEDDEVWERHLWAALASEAPVRCELRLRPAGEERWALLLSSRMERSALPENEAVAIADTFGPGADDPAEGTDVPLIHTLAVDLTNRGRADLRREQALDLAEGLADALPLLWLVVGTGREAGGGDPRVARAGGELCRRFRVEAGDLEGRPLASVLGGRLNDQRLREAVRDALEGAGLQASAPEAEARTAAPAVRVGPLSIQVLPLPWGASGGRSVLLVVEDASRVAAMWRETRQARGELDAFLTSVSHDLKVPLRGILGFTRAVIDDNGEALGQEGLDYLRRVEEAANRMQDTLDALMDLSRVPRRRLERSTVDLTAMAESIAAELRLRQPERAARFRIAPELTARADSPLARVLLTNLLDNAWKFTEGVEEASQGGGALILFDCREEGGERVFRVADNGPGFDPKEAGRLFRPFHRLHGEAYPGHGIGLVLARRIVRKHGGWIRAEGRPGEGAAFCFTLEPAGAEHRDGTPAVWGAGAGRPRAGRAHE